MAPTHPPPPIITVLDDKHDPKQRVAKKLQKKRPADPTSPNTIMDLPERLKGGDDNEEEDLVPNQGMNMNQSIFGLIAAAGTRVDFHDRFEGHSSDDDEEEAAADDADATRRDKLNRLSLYDKLDKRRRPPADPSKTTVLSRESSDKSSRHRRIASGPRKLFASLPKLPSRKTRNDKKAEDVKMEMPSEEASESSELSQSDSRADQGQRLAPVMSRMLEARADVALRPSFDMERLSGEHSRYRASGESGPSPLATRLMEIFEFDEAEEVIEGTCLVYLESPEGLMLTVRTRISVLAPSERTAARLHVHHVQAHLLLCLLAQESGKFPASHLSRQASAC